ncbi:dihydrofolate reductase family protein [Pedobacter terrae]|uniref:dihydrofolate reductase family protein n=1 Tax=Pedobacter terrae TaxID=405671 RepID=UPI002FFC29B5
MKPADYLLGRKTFDIWEEYWPNHAEFWMGINEGTKYVLSTTRKSSDWKNTIFIQGIADIKRIKAAEGGDIHVWGSSKTVQLLLEHDLVDELKLKIHPILLGDGKKLFNSTSKFSTFRLISSITTPKGVIIVHYIKAE